MPIKPLNTFEELKEKAKHVEWNKGKRKEHYAIFAKSFSKKTKEAQCFDLRDISRATNP